MRKLTLVRKKSFVGCACRVFVYRTLSAGEPTYDLLLNGVPCLLVTTLKNGKQTEIERGVSLSRRCGRRYAVYQDAVFPLRGKPHRTFNHAQLKVRTVSLSGILTGSIRLRGLPDGKFERTPRKFQIPSERKSEGVL